jgi:hypothetical protein
VAAPALVNTPVLAAPGNGGNAPGLALGNGGTPGNGGGNGLALGNGGNPGNGGGPAAVAAPALVNTPVFAAPGNNGGNPALGLGNPGKARNAGNGKVK